MLAEFYNATNGQAWLNNSGWLVSSVHECNWTGIICTNDTQKVIGINLPDNAVVGTLPASLSNLPLRILVLGNDLPWYFGPPADGHPLMTNQISGTLDPSFSRWNELEILDLTMYVQWVAGARVHVGGIVLDERVLAFLPACEGTLSLGPCTLRLGRGTN